MNGNDDGLNLLYGAFESMRAQNTETVRHAEEVIQEYMHQPKCISSFFIIIMNCEVPVYRQMAALFMRKVIVLFWNDIDSNNQNEFKRCILERMVAEQEDLVRRAICGVVSVLAAFLLKRGQWPEILDRMNTLLYSANTNDREMGQLLVYSLHQSISQYVSCEDIYKVLAGGLTDNDKPVRVMAVKATCDVITSCINEEEISYYESLFPLLLNLIPDFVQNQDYDVLLRLLGLFDDMTASDDSSFYINHLPNILSICCSLLQDNSLLYSVRCLAGNAISSLVQCNSLFLTSHNLVEPIVSAALSIMPEGIYENGNNDTNVPGAVCDMIINSVAIHYKTSLIYPAIMSYVTPRVTSQQWEERYVAVNSVFLIVEGCQKLVRRDLESLCLMIRPLLSDPIPVVSKKASYFFTEASDHMGKALIEVAPWLIQDIGEMINSQQPYYTENGLVILETVGLDYGKTHQEDMLSICPLLLRLLQDSSCPIQISILAMSCITVVVMTCKKSFTPFINSVLPLAYSILTTRDEERSLLRRRALEFIGKVINHCGYEIVQNDIERILNEVDQLMNSGDSSFGITGYNFFEVLAENCKPAREEFKPVVTALASYLPVIIELIWGDHDICVNRRQTATDEFGRIGRDDTNNNNDQDIIVADTVSMKKKASAIDAMMAICQNVSSLMDAYYQDVINCLLSSTEHVHEDIRLKSYECLEVMLKEVYYYEEEVEWENGDYDYTYSDSVNSLIENYLMTIYDSLIDEPSYEVHLAILSLLDTMVSTLGPSFLISETSKLFELLQKCIQGKTKAEEVYREENDFVEGVEEANAHPIPTAAIDTLGSIITVLGANETYLPHYMTLWNDAKVYLSRWNSADDIVSCYSMCSTLLEVYGQQSVFVVQDIMNLIPLTAKYDDEYCRANTFYLIGLLIMNFSSQCEMYLQQFAEILEQGLQPIIGDEGRATDNAVYTLIRMDTAYPNRFTNVIFSLVLQHLPLQVDKYEEVMCIEYLERLLSSNAPLYMANIQRIVQILGSYCVYYQEEEDESSAINSVLQQISVLREIAPQELDQAITSLDAETMVALSSLFNWFVCFSVHYTCNCDNVKTEG